MHNIRNTLVTLQVNDLHTLLTIQVQIYKNYISFKIDKQPQRQIGFISHTTQSKCPAHVTYSQQSMCKSQIYKSKISFI